jgi:hypothetical protein
MEHFLFRQKIEEAINTEPLNNLKLKFIDVGADKAVFETTGSDRKLVKVSIDVLKSKISNLLYGVVSDKTEKFQKNKINEQRIYEQEIAEVFGSEHLLRKGIFRAKIPLTKEILLEFIDILDEDEKSLLEKLDGGAVYEVEMIAETQLIANELKNPEKFQTKSFNTSLIISDDFRSAEDIQDALSRVRHIVDNNFLLECDELFENDSYKNIVKGIVEKIIAYSKKTGLMIDIFGPNNITIFTKEDGSLDYHLLDAVLPGSQKQWEENIKDDKNLQLLRHHYTFFYSINSLAKKLDIEDNLEMQDLVYFKNGEIPTGKLPMQ